MPEREAMNHLGHKSRAVHWAYARDAKSVSLPLEHYEQMKDKKVIDFDSAQDDTSCERSRRFKFRR